MLHRHMYPLRMLVASVMFVSVLALPIFSYAGVTLQFIPIEEAKFLVRGVGWQHGTSVNLTIDYDTSYLTAPEATAMGGGLYAQSGSGAAPGRLQLTILNEEHSPAFEVCIFFQKQGAYPAIINFVTAQMTDITGAQQPVPVVMRANPNIPVPDQTESAMGALQ